MNESNITYNGLPRIHPDMKISPDHIKNLVAMIARYGLGKKLGIHLLHKHESIPDGQVKLEKKLETTSGKWVRPISIDSLNLNNIHGVAFKVVPGENRLVPYEFGEGISPVCKSDVADNGCVKDFISYTTKHDLVDAISLQFLDGQPKECTAEVELEQYGTIVLPKSMVNGIEFTPTGWPDSTQPVEPEGSAPGEHWAKVKVGTKETHRVFVDQVEDEKELMDKLILQGVIIKV
ncbi:predicted protein [Histoplasma capsulatum var. duboisii H88]|uniref:Predicted protein n=2 Tax=Ajellomyces capsulatus (strain H88) TaxID=544711 RepID=F0UN08_AJEC8|nr:predicted protein [Histoplasma capsulatum var. duboisii H88]